MHSLLYFQKRSMFTHFDTKARQHSQTHRHNNSQTMMAITFDDFMIQQAYKEFTCAGKMTKKSRRHKGITTKKINCQKTQNYFRSIAVSCELTQKCIKDNNFIKQSNLTYSLTHKHAHTNKPIEGCGEGDKRRMLDGENKKETNTPPEGKVKFPNELKATQQPATAVSP